MSNTQWSFSKNDSKICKIVVLKVKIRRKFQNLIEIIGPFIVITGAGIHSDKSGAKIKPTVEKSLKDKRLTYTEQSNGSFSVTL